MYHGWMYWNSIFSLLTTEQKWKKYAKKRIYFQTFSLCLNNTCKEKCRSLHNYPITRVLVSCLSFAANIIVQFTYIVHILVILYNIYIVNVIGSAITLRGRRTTFYILLKLKLRIKPKLIIKLIEQNQTYINYCYCNISISYTINKYITI